MPTTESTPEQTSSIAHSDLHISQTDTAPPAKKLRSRESYLWTNDPDHIRKRRKSTDPLGAASVVTHPRGRIGHSGGGSRRGVGGGISIGNANGSGNGSGYGSGGGVRHEQEHRGGFDAQRRGRGHQCGPGQPRRQLGPQMAFARAWHAFPAQPPPPPFFAPPMPPPPPFYGAYYGPMIGYAHP